MPKLAFKHLPRRIAAGLLGAMLAGAAVAEVEPAPGGAPAASLPNAAAPAKVRISQATSLGPDITVYLDVRAENGQFVRGLTAERLAATVGEQTAAVGDVEPFFETTDGVTYLFLVDISKSLTTDEFGKIRGALADWVSALRPQDRAGILTFGDDVTTLVDVTADRNVLADAIDGLTATDMNTALHRALVEGMERAARRGGDLPERRVIVTLTDGVDDRPGLASAEEVRDRIAEDHIPIYAVGYATRAYNTPAVRAGLHALGEFARRSGGEFVDASGRDDLPGAFSEMRRRIQEVYKTQLRCTDCPLDGRAARLLLTLHSDGFDIDDGIDVRLTPDPNAQPEVAPSPEPPVSWVEQYWPYLAGGVALLALVLLWVILLARRRRARAGARAAPGEEDLSLDLSTSLGADLPPGSFDLGPAPAVPPGPVPAPPQPLDKPAAAPPPRVQTPTGNITVAITSGSRSGERLTLRLAPDAVIGRAPSCAVSLGQDPEASARHARIEILASGRIVLRDLDSTNGTFLNGVKVQGIQPLTDGDLIGVGQSEFRIGL